MLALQLLNTLGPADTGNRIQANCRSRQLHGAGFDHLRRAGLIHQQTRGQRLTIANAANSQIGVIRGLVVRAAVPAHSHFAVVGANQIGQ